MITPFEVYLVMQLSSISCAIGIVAVALFLAGVFYILPLSTPYGESKEALARWRKAQRRCFIWAGILWALCALLPDSKTAAAMIVVPAITSDEVVAPVKDEAKELYGLAKQALQNLANDKPEVEKK